MKRLLLVASITFMGYASAHATCVAKCADGYELGEEETKLIELCESSPDYETCRCILVRTFCTSEHKGVSEENFHETEGQTFCAVVEYLREHLSTEQWRAVTELLEEERLVCVD